MEQIKIEKILKKIRLTLKLSLQTKEKYKGIQQDLNRLKGS
jgi:hypothetical protein